jgi:hypothetical protein
MHEGFVSSDGSIYSANRFPSDLGARDFVPGVRSAATIFSNETPMLESESVLGTSDRSGHSRTTYSYSDSNSLGSQTERSMDSRSSDGLFTYRSTFSLNSWGTVDTASTGGSYLRGISSTNSTVSETSQDNTVYYSTDVSIDADDLSSHGDRTKNSLASRGGSLADDSFTTNGGSAQFSRDTDRGRESLAFHSADGQFSQSRHQSSGIASLSGSIDSDPLIPQHSMSIFSNQTKTVTGYGYLDQDSTTSISGYRSKMYSLVGSSREGSLSVGNDAVQQADQTRGGAEKKGVRKKSAYKSPIPSIRSDTSATSGTYSFSSRTSIDSVWDDAASQVSVADQSHYTGGESLSAANDDLYMSSSTSENSSRFDTLGGGNSRVYSRGSSANSNSSDWSYLSVNSRMVSLTFVQFILKLTLKLCRLPVCKAVKGQGQVSRFVALKLGVWTVRGVTWTSIHREVQIVVD